MKKFISVFTALTTVLWLVGGLFAIPVHAVTIVDGDVVREASGIDVYIIKLVGTDKFKRLILNPDVFNMYGHLKWENVKVVAAGTLDAYTTSTLVRAINDEKVYNLYPDGDTGTKKWVESLACFTSKGYNWNSVYVINSFDRDSYTTASTTLCGEEVTTGAINLSLASDTAKASTLPKNAYGVSFMKVNVSGSGTISQVVVKRSGAGAVADFANVYIYEGAKRLTSGRTVSSATSKVTFIGLKLKAPTTFEVVADLAGTGGNQDYFTIESASDVTANATIGGSFPLAGNPMSLSGTNAGTLTVERSGSTAYNVTVGDKEAEISQFKVSAASEGTEISRIQLYNGGSLNSAKLINVKLKVGGVTVATADAFGADGYVVFSWATPYSIKKGGNAIFRVYADISGGKPAENIKIYLELASDILGVGTTYGYGMAATITNYTSTSSSTYITATLVGGDLTLTKTGPNAGNIGLDTDDTVFLEYTISAIADITVNRTRVFWCQTATDGTTYVDLVTNFSDIEDIKITNKDTGAVWVGPVDGSSFVTAGDDYCTNSKDAVYYNYTDTFDLTAGEVYNLKITGDVRDADNTATTDVAAGDVIKVGLYSYSTLVGTGGNVNFIKYTGTTNAVAGTAIVPSGDIVGEEMTLRSPSLTVTLAGSPSGTDSTGTIGTARTFVKGKTSTDTVGLVFTAGVASDIKVTDLTLSAYVECGGALGTYSLGLQDTNCYAKNLISSVDIYDTTTGAKVPGSTTKGFGGTNYSTVAYSGLNWTILAGESRTLLVKSNLSTTGPTAAADFDLVTFDITTASSDITCQDKDSNAVTATGSGRNGTTDPNVAIGVYDYGSLAVAKANDTPKQSILVMGSKDNEVSMFKLTGTREAFYVERFSIDISEETASRSNFTGVALKYQTSAQSGTSDWTISSKKTFANLATLSFDFTGSARPYVVKDDSVYITALVDVNGYVAGTGAKSGDYTYFSAATDTNEIKAYGAESGHFINVVASEPATTDFANHYIFRSKPVFAKKAWSGDVNELARFTISAVGYDVTFDGTDANDGGMGQFNEAIVSAGLEFDVIASGTDNASTTLTLYDWNNSIVSSVSGGLNSADYVTENRAVSGTDASCNNATYECLTTVSFHFAYATSATVIPVNTTKEFYIMSDNMQDFDTIDEYVQLKLLNDQGDITAVTGTADNTYNFDNCNIVWYDGSNDESTRTVFEHRICMPANTKGMGDFPFSFRFYQGAGTTH